MPQVSVVIAAYRADATLGRVLSALQHQLSSDVEVVVVDSTGLGHAEALQRTYPWLRVIGRDERTAPAAARNLGVENARGTRLVFLDADAVPATHWLARLQRGLNRGGVAVAGAVGNGTPRSLVGTATYLLEFSEWTAQRRGVPLHGATCNLIVERHAFEAAGGFCEDLWMGEDTVLTLPWGREGRLGYAADAQVWHLNRTGLNELLTHQYRLGRAFASVSDRVNFPGSAFSRWPLLPVAPAARLAVLLRRLSRDPGLRRQVWGLSPLLALGLVAWATGAAVERGFPGSTHPGVNAAAARGLDPER
jgi:glycosyltransferase involved in cell wall biosynthesis